VGGVLDHLSEPERDAVTRRGQPTWCAPMLATLTDRPFSALGWLYERKLDGERALAFKHGSKVRLYSRNRKDIGATYPELIDALAAQHADSFIADGEVVAFDGPVTSFARLQQRMKISNRDEARASDVRVCFYLFDLVHWGGFALTRLPLRSRKRLLRLAIAFRDPLRFTAHRNRAGLAYLDEACKKGWEGVIAKCAHAPYQHRRSTAWLKFKCAKGQELVIGGYTAPKGSRVGFGALLVGYYRNGDLRYVGKVGTGYDRELLKSLGARLERLRRSRSPFKDSVGTKGVTWVAPKLVGEFAFTEWTRDGKLRHPRFLGLRRDKPAKDVVRERAV
jgi:DNA ligase D-like protein (predicted ligase)